MGYGMGMKWGYKEFYYLEANDFNLGYGLENITSGYICY